MVFLKLKILKKDLEGDAKVGHFLLDSDIHYFTNKGYKQEEPLGISKKTSLSTPHTKLSEPATSVMEAVEYLTNLNVPQGICKAHPRTQNASTTFIFFRCLRLYLSNV